MHKLSLFWKQASWTEGACKSNDSKGFNRKDTLSGMQLLYTHTSGFYDDIIAAIRPFSIVVLDNSLLIRSVGCYYCLNAFWKSWGLHGIYWSLLLLWVVSSDFSLVILLSFKFCFYLLSLKFKNNGDRVLATDATETK